MASDMSKSYSITRQDDILIITYDEKTSVQDAKASISEVASIPENNKRLYDCTKLDFASSTMEDVKELVQHSLGKFSPGSIKAVVVADDLGYGLNRAFEGMRFEEKIESMVFRSKADALEWIKKK